MTEGDETRGDWVLVGGRVCLQPERGPLFGPSVMEVFRAVFSGDCPVLGGIQPIRSLREALPSMTFSRFPADVALRITGGPGAALGMELGAFADGCWTDVEREADQVVCNGTWFPLEEGSVAAAADWLLERGMGVDGRATLGDLVRLRAAQQLPFRLIDEVGSGNWVAPRIEGPGPAGIPGLMGTLYGYQAQGVGFLNRVAAEGIGCVLGDEMGLGKTLQIIALLLLETAAGRRPSLVVAPTTLLENWRRELSLFAPTLAVLVHWGSDRAGAPRRLEVPDVVITSYDIAIRDEPVLSSVQWNIVVLDEAQNIKNSDAQRTSAVKGLPRRVSIAVSGTPVENRLEDLWSIADFVLPGFLGDLPSFRIRFANELAGAAALAQVISPLLLRRKVAEVAQDLPSRIEIPQAITMAPRQASEYEACRQEVVAEYGPSAGLVSLTRLRVFCARPHYGHPPNETPKYTRLLEILGEVFAAGQKALVFASFQDTLDTLSSDVAQRWSSGYFRVIDGRVPVGDRQTVIDGLFAATGAGALFLNPRAAGTGLNITAANHVIHFDPEWNPAVTDQATARAYRRKQELPVTVHHLFYAGSVEEVIVGRASFKRDLASEATTGHVGEAELSTLALALAASPFSMGELVS